MHIYKNKKGFTLIEMLLSVALLALVVALSSDIIITLVRTNTKAQVATEVEQVANFIFLKMQNDIKNSLDADMEGSTLVLRQRGDRFIRYAFVDPVSAPSYITWDDSTDGLPAASLTDVNSSKGVQIDCYGACFNISEGLNIPTKVRISLELSQINTSSSPIFNSTVILEDTFIVRGTF